MKHFLLLVVAAFCSAVQANEFECAHYNAAAPIDSPIHRKFAPDRVVDIEHVLLDVKPDFVEHSVAGKMKMRFKPIAKPTRELRLNAIDLRVKEVTSTAPIEAWENTGEEIVVLFKEAIADGNSTELQVIYSAFPKKGMYFRSVNMGYREEDEQLFTQGEDIEARHWFPTHDFPNEKFTSEVICEVPEKMTVLSNGKLMEEKTAGGVRQVRYLQDKPHTAYLICIVAGRLKGIKDQYKEIPLGFYTPESDIELAQSSFKETKAMMAYFEEEIGVAYPWAKYDQVAIRDFMWGGMENTTLTTLTDNTLFPTETENIRSSQGLVAHELVHQWFGDLVTTKDWAHIWLNEGFATYYAALYAKHADGVDEFRYDMYNMAKGFIGKNSVEDSRPTVFRQYDNATELFGYLVYPKGAWILHMLRAQLGDDLFRKVIKTYLERHQFGSVVTPDLVKVVEEMSGRSFDQFFDQWVYRPHFPELNVSYSWDGQSRMAKISVSQAQQLINEIGIFRFPLKVRFKGAFGTKDHDVSVTGKQEDYFVPLPSAPASVRIDPEYNLLARVNFEPSRPLLLEQLKDKEDVIGRLLAVQALGKGRDADTVKLLGETLQNDSFYGVRIEAAQQLRGMQSDEALKVLLAGAEQKDARVRQQVLMQIARFNQADARAHVLAQIEKEKNPDIVHHAAMRLGTSNRKETGEQLAKLARSKSHRNIVADGAVNAMRSQNDPGYIPELLEILKTRELDFTAPGYSRAMDTLAYLARHEQDKTAVRDFLIGKIESRRNTIKSGAVNALATLQDAAAIPVLENIASGSKYVPASDAAEKAVNSLRAGRKPVDEFQSLRGEVQDLKKQNTELKSSVEELKKKVSALPVPEMEKPKTDEKPKRGSSRKSR